MSHEKKIVNMYFMNNLYCKLLKKIDDEQKRKKVIEKTPLGLGSGNKSPSLDEALEIWMMSPWINELPPDALLDELAALDMVLSSLQGTTVEKWCSFSNKESAPNLLKLVLY